MCFSNRLLITKSLLWTVVSYVCTQFWVIPFYTGMNPRTVLSNLTNKKAKVKLSENATNVQRFKNTPVELLRQDHFGHVRKTGSLERFIFFRRKMYRNEWWVKTAHYCTSILANTGLDLNNNIVSSITAIEGNPYEAWHCTNCMTHLTGWLVEYPTDYPNDDQVSFPVKQ